MQALRTLPRAGVRAFGRSTMIRPMSTGISDGGMGRAWADREHAAEKQYFNKKDAEILARLAKKLQNHTAPTAESIAEEKQAIQAIFSKHNTEVPEALLEDLVKFKFNHH